MLEGRLDLSTGAAHNKAGGTFPGNPNHEGRFIRSRGIQALRKRMQDLPGRIFIPDRFISRRDDVDRDVKILRML